MHTFTSPAFSNGGMQDRCYWKRIGNNVLVSIGGYITSDITKGGNLVVLDNVNTLFGVKETKYAICGAYSQNASGVCLACNQNKVVITNTTNNPLISTTLVNGQVLIPVITD